MDGWKGGDGDGLERGESRVKGSLGSVRERVRVRARLRDVRGKENVDLKFAYRRPSSGGGEGENETVYVTEGTLLQSAVCNVHAEYPHPS